MLRFPEKENIAAFMGVAAVITNTGSDIFRLEAYINSNRWISSAVYLESREEKTLQIVIPRKLEEGNKYFPGMRAFPGWSFDSAPINSAKIETMTFRVYTKASANLTVSRIKFFGALISPKQIAESPDFFPILDRFGQYKHADWPGKIKSDTDLIQANAAEEKVLKSLPGAAGRDRFGGWAEGPKLKATGHFRVEKREGTWWLVDPDGICSGLMA